MYLCFILFIYFFVYVYHTCFIPIQVVSALPDDIRPGPDLYGLPWEPVIFSGLVGLMTVLLFTCRCYSSVSTSASAPQCFYGPLASELSLVQTLGSL